jgi:hypothetical protein
LANRRRRVEAFGKGHEVLPAATTIGRDVQGHGFRWFSPVSKKSIAAIVEGECRAGRAAQVDGALNVVVGRCVRLTDAQSESRWQAVNRIGRDGVLSGRRRAIVIHFYPVAGPQLCAVVSRVSDGVEIIAHGLGGEDGVPVLLRPIAECDVRLDAADLVFQIPVTAEQRASGQIRARGDIGAGQRREIVNQSLAFAAAGKVAAVEHEVRVGLQRFAPTLDDMRESPHVVLTELAGAELQSSVGSMGDDVHGIQVPVAGQGFGDLLDAVAVAVDDDDLDLPPLLGRLHQVIDELLVVGRAGIDEDYLAPLLDGLAELIDDGDLRGRAVLGYRGDRRGSINIQDFRIDGDNGRIRGEQQPRFEFFHDRTATMGIR